MLKPSLLLLLLSLHLSSLVFSQCISSGDQTAINNALSAGGPGTLVQLCTNALISLTDSVYFTADDQEISTAGYPTDDSRATLQIAVGNDVTTLVRGVGFNHIRILNIQIDGNRPNTGYYEGGGANIELGGVSNGQTIKFVASKNPRTWSCMHIVESGDTSNPCTNATIANNDIGPCGVEGTEASAEGMWADGISFACTNSVVASNTISGSTDGGIVIYGATESAFGAINLVDKTYGGYYGNVIVSDNRITGQKFFNLGIAIGQYVWSFDDPYVLQGPVTITNNSIAGNVAFPIAINGWTDGVTVSDTDISHVTTPRSSFVSDGPCSATIQGLLSANDGLVYYPAGVAGPVNLQSDFVAADASIGNFLCTGSIDGPIPKKARMRGLERRWKS
ncbi:hypothetical protein MMC12_008350 [Toensbergia leucococca]|nr:hypothetical protein [Toensbergia leucococca]